MERKLDAASILAKKQIKAETHVQRQLRSNHSLT
nr:unnamed protein product [Callosobruchus chinensis]CAH7730270.1 unnamed protein product [Callosobruchus chinensis]CAH7739479.1 unnamed protein product [Callosobruchus chinensis]CAH7755622.1 unnamed protein product [Callosobruchus chinensis]